MANREAIVRGIRKTVRLLILLIAGTGLAFASSSNAAAASPPAGPVPALQALGMIPPGYSTDLFDVKFRDGLTVRLRNDQLAGLSLQASQALARILNQYPVLHISRLITLPEERVDALRAAAASRSGKAMPDMNLWFRFTLEDGAQGERFMSAMQQLDGVETVYPAPLPQPPPAEPSATTPDLTSRQDYLKPAPLGVDGPYAWKVPGGNGAGITITDIEYSWNEEHEDLSKAHGLALLLNPGDEPVDPFNSNNHGTAAVGVLVGDDNTLGITGIAWGADIQLAPANTVQLGYNLVNAIFLATNASQTGDIIEIEQQMGVCNLWNGYGPVEWDPPVYQQIQIAVGLGITVVEAAGNGSVNLDQASCEGRFNRNARDSGAIIAGAGQSGKKTIDRQREPFSDYGSRVDLQSQGDSVATSGYAGRMGGYCDTPYMGYWDPDDPQNPNSWYTFCFNGTSSATPIIAAAAADIQGAAKVKRGVPLSPRDLRTLLVSTGSPQQANLGEHIGPRPDLKKALLWLREW